MSEPGETGGNGTDPRGDELRNLPVLADPPAEARPLGRPPPAAVPAPVAAATGGFLAGFITFMVVRILRGRSRHRPRVSLRRTRRGDALEVAGTRSFLVDVHLLKR